MFLDRELRQQFERELVRCIKPEVLSQYPEDTKARWVRRFEAAMEQAARPELTKQGRRLNGFCLGSDPEFIFTSGGRKANAVDLGLKPALAAGCDQNQRLAELRCWPTRSAVEHVAGILASLRWMYRLYPDTRAFMWRAGAFYDGDGIGGHVHFGRKRPTRQDEIAGLDGLTWYCRQMGLFNTRDWEKRIGGDARNQRYGDYGDFRKQLHGYEYRTLPSWLCSPLKAFTMLTITKLAVLDPDIVRSWRNIPFQGAAGWAALQRLAQYYAGRDDDAWLLKYMLANKTLQAAAANWCVTTEDFKVNWGFADDAARTAKQPKSQILAACVRPCDAEIAEVGEHLLTSKAIEYKEHPPTFRADIPTGYNWLYSGRINGIQYAGAGDLTHNLVRHKESPIDIFVGTGFFVGHDLWSGFTADEQKLVKKLYPAMRPHRDYNRVIAFDRNSLGVDGIKTAKRLLLHSGLFPLWTVDSVQADSFSSWLSKRKKVVKTKQSPHERSL